MTDRISRLLDAWVEGYVGDHLVHPNRVRALRVLLSDCFETCCALVETNPSTRQEARVRAFLKGLRSERAKTLKANRWQLDVLDWIATQRSFVTSVCDHNRNV